MPPVVDITSGALSFLFIFMSRSMCLVYPDRRLHSLRPGEACSVARHFSEQVAYDPPMWHGRFGMRYIALAIGTLRSSL